MSRCNVVPNVKAAEKLVVLDRSRVRCLLVLLSSEFLSSEIGVLALDLIRSACCMDASKFDDAPRDAGRSCRLDLQSLISLLPPNHLQPVPLKKHRKTTGDTDWPSYECHKLAKIFLATVDQQPYHVLART